jgi:hypothetical protein
MKWIIVAAFAIGAWTNLRNVREEHKELNNSIFPKPLEDLHIKRYQFHLLGLVWDSAWTILAILLLP